MLLHNRFFLGLFFNLGFQTSRCNPKLFMPINKYLDRLHQLDYLISHKSTGTPKELAHKMNVSVSVVYRYLNFLKGFGAPLRWCSYTGSYVYDWEGKLELRFLPTEPAAKSN